jgi:hypothetical protein
MKLYKRCNCLGPMAGMIGNTQELPALVWGSMYKKQIELDLEFGPRKQVAPPPPPPEKKFQCAGSPAKNSLGMLFLDRVLQRIYRTGSQSFDCPSPRNGYLVWRLGQAKFDRKSEDFCLIHKGFDRKRI